MVLYFDTSFLMSTLRHKIDLFEIVEKFGRVKAIVPSTLLNELAAIKGRGGKDAQIAVLAELLLRKKIEAGDVKVVITQQSVDEFILQRARTNDIVCTNDKAMRKSLKKRGIKTAITRGRSILI